MTRQEAAIITAFTGILCGSIRDFQAYVENKLDRPVWTHEFAGKELADEIKEAAREDFIAICKQVSDSPAWTPPSKKVTK